MSRVFKATPTRRDRRWLLEFTGRGVRNWHRDTTGNFRTYFAARFHAAIWNSLGYDARITDTWEESR